LSCRAPPSRTARAGRAVAPAFQPLGQIGAFRAGGSGSAISSRTSWSPRVPSLRVKPLPFSRSVLPEELPGATVSITAPSTVGTAHLAAVHRLVQPDGQIEANVVAIAAEEGVGRMAMVMIASPAPPGP
jgi:hypothetical protein